MNNVGVHIALIKDLFANITSEFSTDLNIKLRFYNNLSFTRNYIKYHVELGHQISMQQSTKYDCNRAPIM